MNETDAKVDQSQVPILTEQQPVAEQPPVVPVVAATDERFKCPECDRVFRTGGGLGAHRLKRHDVKGTWLRDRGLGKTRVTRKYRKYRKYRKHLKPRVNDSTISIEAIERKAIWHRENADELDKLAKKIREIADTLGS